MPPPYRTTFDAYYTIEMHTLGCSVRLKLILARQTMLLVSMMHIELTLARLVCQHDMGSTS